MRIMHISRSAVILRHFLVPVMTAQKKMGHHVCMCTDDSPDAEYLRSVGFEIFTYEIKRSLNPLGILKAIQSVSRILIEQRIDVIICHTLLGAGVGRIAAWLAKTPCVIYFAHGLACAPGQNALSWWLRYWTEKLQGYVTEAILVMNDYDENICRTRYIIKNTARIFRIPGMGVDLTKYNIEGFEKAKQKLVKELSIGEDRKIVLCVAMLIPEKGVLEFLEAARRIRAQRNDVCFLVAGTGPLMDKLKKLVCKNHLEANVKLLGWRDDVPMIMKAADIFTLPTYFYEGLPVSILEAMACGKPTVATRHRGCEDVVVDGETGFLVPVKQVSPLVDKILLLLDNDQLRTEMGQAGLQRVQKFFELNYCTDKIIEALEKAIH